MQVKDAKVIGASGDSVEGTDIVVPKLTLSLARRPPRLNGDYIKNLSRLTGKTKKGRERVRQHGEFWRVDMPHSLPHRLLLWSEKTGDWRWGWIDGEDVHFTVEGLS